MNSYAHTPITNEKDRPTKSLLFSSQRSTKGTSHRPSNTSPKNLTDENGILRERNILHTWLDASVIEIFFIGALGLTKSGRSGLCHDHVLRLEKFSHTRPQPVLGNNLVSFLRERICPFGDVDRECLGFIKGTEGGSEFGKEGFHPNARIFGEFDLCSGSVELKGDDEITMRTIY